MKYNYLNKEKNEKIMELFDKGRTLHTESLNTIGFSMKNRGLAECFIADLRLAPKKILNFWDKINNCTNEDIVDFIGKLEYGLYDFLSGDNKTLAFVLLLACLHLHSGYSFYKKLLSHEKSKKLYFFLYAISIMYIIVQCLLLLTSELVDISQEGILFSYIYATATLMLFLIFLALTTCESYLYKAKDLQDPSSSLSLFRVVTTNTIIAIPVFFYYYGIFTAGHASYYCKLSIFLENYEFGPKTQNLDFHKKPIVDLAYLESKKPKSKNIFGVFESLKNDILDTKYGYILSALIQTAALVIIIISIVI